MQRYNEKIILQKIGIEIILLKNIAKVSNKVIEKYLIAITGK